MALDACANAVVNPSFESGSLYPWVPSAVSVAKVSNGTSAYSGNYYLSVPLFLEFFFKEDRLADAYIVTFRLLLATGVTPYLSL
jgi:hypothetical protein